MTPLVGFGDYTWVDANANGLQDAGEQPIAGVLVELLDVNGVPVLDGDGNAITALTDATGHYFIDELDPGTYRVRFTPPAGYSLTYTRTGHAGTDSNPDPQSHLTPPFVLTAAVGGNMIADTDELTLATFRDPTIDAGVVFGRLPETGGNVQPIGEGAMVVLLLGIEIGRAHV